MELEILVMILGVKQDELVILELEPLLVILELLILRLVMLELVLVSLMILVQILG